MASAKAISTRGRLSPSRKKAMTLSTRGWLVFVGDEPTYHAYVEEGRHEEVESSGASANALRRKRIIENDDDEVLSIIKMWLRCR